MSQTTQNFKANWKKNLSNPKFKYLFLSSLIYFSIFPLKADSFFQWIQQRNGIQLNDFILNAIEPSNNSHLIFGIIYVSVIYLLISLIKRPKDFIVFAWAFNIETTFRFLCIYFIPLNPPFNLVDLHDPLAEIFIYGENLAITKDLFFSGHTATMIFVCYFVVKPWEKIGAYLLTALLIALLLIQHIHYSIDILGAFFFTALSIGISKKLITYEE